MPIGYQFNDEETIGGVKTTYENDTQTFKSGMTFQTPLLTREKGAVYSFSSISFGNTSLNKDRDKHSSQFEAVSEIHYATTEGSLFADTHIGTDISLNRTYNQTVDWDSEIGFYPGLKKENDSYQLTANFGPHPVNNSSERTNKNCSLDIGLNAGVALGFRTINDQAFYGFGRVDQEITNKKNTTVDLGLGTGGVVNIWGAEFNYNIEAGYRKNLNKELTNNFAKIGGWHAGINLGIPL